MDVALAKTMLICWPVVEALKANLLRRGRGGAAELYFVTLKEWLSFFPEKGDDAAVATYLNWYIQHRFLVETLREQGREVRLLNLLEEPVGDVYLEEILAFAEPEPAGKAVASVSLFAASDSFQEPLGAGAVLHTPGGEALAAAIGWDTGLCEAGRTKDVVTGWAKANGATDIVSLVNPSDRHGAFPLKVRGRQILLPMVDAGAAGSGARSRLH